MRETVLRLSPYALGETPRAMRAKPHDPAAMAEVRRLIETTALSYRAIARRTGIARSTISRHVLTGGWIRPMTDLSPPPTPEGARRARRGELADRILRAAENQVFQVEMNPTASAVAFARAVRLLKLAQQLDRPGQPRNRVARAKRVTRPASP